MPSPGETALNRAPTPYTVVSRSLLMSLIITFMLEPAKLQMNWARARGTSILRGETAVLATFRLSAMWLLKFRCSPGQGWRRPWSPCDRHVHDQAVKVRRSWPQADVT